MAQAEQVVGEPGAGEEEGEGEADVERVGLVVYEQPEGEAQAEGDRGGDQQAMEGQEGHSATVAPTAMSGNVADAGARGGSQEPPRRGPPGASPAAAGGFGSEVARYVTVIIQSAYAGSTSFMRARSR